LGRGGAAGARRAPCIVVRLTREPGASTVRAGLSCLKTLSFARCEPRRARLPPKPRAVGAAHGRRLDMRKSSAATAIAVCSARRCPWVGRLQSSSCCPPKLVPRFNESGKLVPTSRRWGHGHQRVRLRLQARSGGRKQGVQQVNHWVGQPDPERGNINDWAFAGVLRRHRVG